MCKSFKSESEMGRETVRSGRKIPPIVKKVLDLDRYLTHKTFRLFRKVFRLNVLKSYLIGLEYSCHSILWLVAWTISSWLISSSRESVHLQFNMIFGLLLDIMLVGSLKAYFRRRHPVSNQEQLLLKGIGPDRYSFPSGHASRSVFVWYFFTAIFPTSILMQLIILTWSILTCLSRLLLERHYILDVLSGILCGLLSGRMLQTVLLSESTSYYIFSMMTNYNNANST